MPKYSGIVIAVKYLDEVRELSVQLNEEIMERERQRRIQLVYLRWEMIIKRLIVRKVIDADFGDALSAPDVISATAVAAPTNIYDDSVEHPGDVFYFPHSQPVKEIFVVDPAVASTNSILDMNGNPLVLDRLIVDSSSDEDENS